jgi:hypothetical protein
MVMDHNIRLFICIGAHLNRIQSGWVTKCCDNAEGFLNSPVLLSQSMQAAIFSAGTHHYSGDLARALLQDASQ